MRCWHCNSEIKDPNVLYCPECGRKLTGSESEGPKNTRTRSSQSGDGKSGNKAKIPVIIAAVLVLGALGISAYSLKAVILSGQERTDSANTAEETYPESNAGAGTEKIAESQPEEKEVEESPEQTGETEDVIKTERSADDVFQPDASFFTYNGHTYGFYDVYTINENMYGNVVDADKGAYKNVQRFCMDQGGHLAIIESMEENDVLFDETRKRYDKTVFFGLSDQNKEGRWIWVDGTDDTSGFWSIKNGVRQPDNGNGNDVENYAEFDYDRFNPNGSDNTGRWNDAAYLKNTHVFICEWDFILTGL